MPQFKNISTGQIVEVKDDDTRLPRLRRMNHRWEELGGAPGPEPEPKTAPGPASGKVDDIIARVGDNPEAAAEVLEAELAKGDKARVTLVEAMESVIAASAGDSGE